MLMHCHTLVTNLKADDVASATDRLLKLPINKHWGSCRINPLARSSLGVNEMFGMD